MIRASVFTATSRPVVLAGKFLVPVWAPCSPLVALVNGVIRFAFNAGDPVPRGRA